MDYTSIAVFGSRCDFQDFLNWYNVGVKVIPEAKVSAILVPVRGAFIQIALIEAPRLPKKKSAYRWRQRQIEEVTDAEYRSALRECSKYEVTLVFTELDRRYLNMQGVRTLFLPRQEPIKAAPVSEEFAREFNKFC